MTTPGQRVGMLHNPFTEDPSPMDCGTAPTNPTPCTSASPLPSKMVRPEDRIKAIKLRMTKPPSTRKTIEIDAPQYDPTVRKKARYEHSLSRLIKKNPRVTATVSKIQQKYECPNKDTLCKKELIATTTEHVDNEVKDNNDLISITDSISNTSSNPPIDIPTDTDIDAENKLLLSELNVSDSEDESSIECTTSTKCSANESDNIQTDQCSNSDSNSVISQTELLLDCTTKPNPYVPEPMKPAPSYVPTPKTTKQEKGRRVVRYIPVSEWMYDQWRIISKANQHVGNAMREAMIEEGLLYARK